MSGQIQGKVEGGGGCPHPEAAYGQVGDAGIVIISKAESGSLFVELVVFGRPRGQLGASAAAPGHCQ